MANELAISCADKPFRVVQWATGSIGQIAIRHFAENPVYELVGALVTSDAKRGKDAGELAGIAPLGVIATTELDDILRLRADCVNYAPLYVDVDDMCAILASGTNIVTPASFIYPAALDRAVTSRLSAACTEGASTLHGAGIHPGFAGDLLPMTFARLSNRIDKLTVQEVADMALHPSAAMCFDGMGFGRDPEEAVADPSPAMLLMDTMFKESIQLLIDGLGIEADDTTHSFEVAVAKRDLEVRAGHIRAGAVGGMRHEWTTWSRGRPVVVFRSAYKMDDDLEPNWTAGHLKYSLVIEGDPAVSVSFGPTEQRADGDQGYWGRVWTAMNSVNAIPTVVTSGPGIKTHLDLPLVRPQGLFR